MKRLRETLPTCLCVVLAWTWASGTLGAEANPWWNPLGIGQSRSHPEQRKVASRKPAPSQSKSSSLGLPSLPTAKLPKLPLLSTGSDHKSTAQQPGMWDSVSSGTKNFLTKTKEVLMPWSDSSKKPPTSKSAAASRKSRSGSSTKGKTENSGFPFLSGSKPQKDDEIRSVNDFLELPRVYE